MILRALTPWFDRAPTLKELAEGRAEQDTGPSEEERAAYDWRRLARPAQLAPAGEWRTWMYLGGRGAGKTRAGAEWVREQKDSGKRRIALVAPTAADARDVMVEGDSGILACSPPWDRPTYNPSLRRVTWSNGAIATLYSADEPDRLRGPQHDAAWGDELAAWRRPEAWDMLLMGLRLGDDPRVVVTTTPRPTALVKGLAAHKATAVTRSTTYENAANLAPAFLEVTLRRYEGTRLGRQELNAEVLEDIEGALWSQAMIDACRVATCPPLVRVVVAIDPAVTAGAESDETGIIVAGVGKDGHGYVIDDRSGRYAPSEWARRAIAAYREHACDRIVIEVNQGGDMAEHTLRMVDRAVPVRRVHASRGKATRAEPVSALYEQGRVHHVGHALAQLEDQLCTWSPGTGQRSPDRLDALVWALTDLIVTGGRTDAAAMAPHFAAAASAPGADILAPGRF